MGKINNDYLWLHERPRQPIRLRRLALLLLVLPLIIGAAWLSSSHRDTPATETVVLTTTGAYSDTPATPAQAEVAVSLASAVRGNAPAEADPVAVTRTAPAPADTIDTALRIEPRIVPARIDSAPQGMTTHKTKAEPTATESAWTRIEIRKGDTLSIAFARNDLAYSDSLAIAHMPRYGKRFTRKLRAGDVLKVKADDQGHVVALNYPLGPTRVMKVRPTEDGFSGVIELADVERRVAYATGVINSSFYIDALQAGLSDRQIMSLVHIFSWTVDFAFDIRPGDRFVVVYNELYKDGKKIADGHILAASFQTSDEEFRAVRFTGYENETDYYAPDGTAMRKAFIRTPVDYTRISSPFSAARDHPILNTIRGHHGTDYAAPMGTPIHATGAGRIVFRGRNGGYGNMVKIKHGNGITTRYGHMSRFASNQGVGSFVEQGEIIGYVGSTGLSTGPHLHYEFRLSGKPQNPETVDLPGAPPLPDQYMDEFKAHVEPMLAQLDALSRVTVAQNEQHGAR